MIAARRREREYFQSTSEYRHLADRMGSEYLGKMMSKVCRFYFCKIGMHLLIIVCVHGNFLHGTNRNTEMLEISFHFPILQQESKFAVLP